MQLRYMVEAVRPFKLDHTSMSYIYKVFEHLLLLLMGIWMDAPSHPNHGKWRPQILLSCLKV